MSRSQTVGVDVDQLLTTSPHRKVALPKDMACTGSSAGNVCTVRCKNASDMGGCIAVQQTDTTPLPADNDPSKIKSAQTLEGIMAQIAQNKKDLPAAIQGNENAGSVAEQGPDIAQAILDSDKAITQNTNAEIAKQGNAASTANTGNANANAGNANANAGNGKGKKKGGANAAGGANANGAATGAATGAAKGNGRGQGNNAGANAAGGAATNNAAGGAATAATGGNGNAATGNGAGRGNRFGNNNKKRMAPAERRAKRYVDVGTDFVVGGN